MRRLAGAQPWTGEWKAATLLRGGRQGSGAEAIAAVELCSRQVTTCGAGWKECGVCASSSRQRPAHSECSHPEQSYVWDAKVQAG